MGIAIKCEGFKHEGGNDGRADLWAARPDAAYQVLYHDERLGGGTETLNLCAECYKLLVLPWIDRASVVSFIGVHELANLVL